MYGSKKTGHDGRKKTDRRPKRGGLKKEPKGSGMGGKGGKGGSSTLQNWRDLSDN